MINFRENPAIPGRSEDRRLVILCPVCREPIEDVRLQEWSSAPRPHLEAGLEDFKMTPELERLQRKMKKLYLRQKDKGSLIDVEAENKKYLVSTSAPTAEAASEAPVNRAVPEQKSETPQVVALAQNQQGQGGASSKRKGRSRHSKRHSSHPDDGAAEDDDQRDQRQPKGGGRQRGGRGGRGHHRYQNQKGARKSEGYRGNSEQVKSELS